MNMVYGLESKVLISLSESFIQKLPLLRDDPIPKL